MQIWIRITSRNITSTEKWIISLTTLIQISTIPPPIVWYKYEYRNGHKYGYMSSNRNTAGKLMTRLATPIQISTYVCSIHHRFSLISKPPYQLNLSVNFTIKTWYVCLSLIIFLCFDWIVVICLRYDSGLGNLTICVWQI